MIASSSIKKTLCFSPNQEKTLKLHSWHHGLPTDIQSHVQRPIDTPQAWRCSEQSARQAPKRSRLLHYHRQLQSSISSATLHTASSDSGRSSSLSTDPSNATFVALLSLPTVRHFTSYAIRIGKGPEAPETLQPHRTRNTQPSPNRTTRRRPIDAFTARTSLTSEPGNRSRGGREYSKRPLCST